MVPVACNLDGDKSHAALLERADRHSMPVSGNGLLKTREALQLALRY